MSDDMQLISVRDKDAKNRTVENNNLPHAGQGGTRLW